MSTYNTGNDGADTDTFRSGNVAWSSVITDLEARTAEAKDQYSRITLGLKSLREVTKHNEMLEITLNAERNTKILQSAKQKGDKELAENKLTSYEVSAEELKSNIEESKEKQFSILDTFNDDADILSQRFLTAPDQYGINKIEAEIDRYGEEILKIEDQIRTEHNPEISKLDSIIENEPTTTLDILGTTTLDILGTITLDILGPSPRDYTSNDLSIIVSRIKESVKNNKEKKGDLTKKFEALKKREDLL